MSEVAERTAEPGVATGLAWTPVGGDILFIEATAMPGTGRLTITGQLGEVMQESAQAALSFVRAKAKWLGIEENFLDKTDIHVHIPADRIQKDMVDVPDQAKNEMEFFYVKKIDELLPLALTEMPEKFGKAPVPPVVVTPPTTSSNQPPPGSA